MMSLSRQLPPANATSAIPIRVGVARQRKQIRARDRRWWRLLRFSQIAILAFAALGITLDQASAQAWPQRPVMLILPYPPGGTVDTQARILGGRLCATRRP